MNKLSRNIYLAALCCLFSFINASSQNTSDELPPSGNVIMALLAETPQETIENCTGNDLMNLLTGNGKALIESIECKNVNIEEGEAGVWLILNESSDFTSFIQFNFKSTPLLEATNITFYGNDKTGGGNLKAQILVNRSEKPNTILTSSSYHDYFSNKSTLVGASAQTVLDGITQGSGDYNPSRIITNSFPDGNRIESCKILFDATNNKGNNKIQIFALRIYYNNLYQAENEEVETSIYELQEDLEREVRYYDLYGRVLTKAPEKGIYLRREGGKTTKHIAY